MRRRVLKRDGGECHGVQPLRHRLLPLRGGSGRTALAYFLEAEQRQLLLPYHAIKLMPAIRTRNTPPSAYSRTLPTVMWRRVYNQLRRGESSPAWLYFIIFFSGTTVTSFSLKNLRSAINSSFLSCPHSSKHPRNRCRLISPLRESSSTNSGSHQTTLPKSRSFTDALPVRLASQMRQTEEEMKRYPLKALKDRISSCSLSLMAVRRPVLSCCPSKKNSARHWSMRCGWTTSARQYLLRKRGWGVSAKCTLQPLRRRKNWETDLVTLCFFPSTFRPPILMSNTLACSHPKVRFSSTMNRLPSLRARYRPLKWLSHTSVLPSCSPSPKVNSGSSFSYSSPKQCGRWWEMAAKGWERWSADRWRQKWFSTALNPFSSLVRSRESSLGSFPLTCSQYTSSCPPRIFFSILIYAMLTQTRLHTQTTIQKSSLPQHGCRWLEGERIIK